MSRLAQLLRAKVLLPWNNLGCLGVKSADGTFYADLFLRDRALTGQPLLCIRALVHDEVVGARRWYTLTWNGWELDRVEQTNPTEFARVCRRTMQPYKEVALVSDERPSCMPRGCRLECISYPFVEDGYAQVMLRELGVGDGSDMIQADCADVRPIDWRRRTGVPAQDPVGCFAGRQS